MAIEFNVTEAEHVFRGEDKTLELEIFTNDTQTVALDVAGFAMSWVLRKHDTHPTALIEKSTADSPAGITITGVFNATPAQNTQRVQIHLADTDTYDTASPTVNIKPGTYRHALKREDIGAETVLAFGDFTLLGATTP